MNFKHVQKNRVNPKTNKKKYKKKLVSLCEDVEQDQCNHYGHAKVEQRHSERSRREPPKEEFIFYFYF